MAKMKEVCQRTGLTEKAVRLYMDQGLISPKVENGVHRNAYYFSEEDIVILQDIAVLRGAGFGIADIKHMQEYPEELPKLLEEKQVLLAEEIYQKQALQEALHRLSVPEYGSSKQLVHALRPAVNQKKLPRPVAEKPYWKIMVIIIIFCILGGAIYVRYTGFGLGLAVALISSVLAIISGVMAYRYGSCEKRAKHMPMHGKGIIVSVIEDHGFDIAFARAGGQTAASKEPGAGGVWQFFFLIWNEIRPDCWYPVVQYYAKEGTQLSGTFPYGGMKHSWKEKDEVEIAWDSSRPEYLLPKNAPWLRQKAVVYAVISVCFVMVTIITVCLLINGL